MDQKPQIKSDVKNVFHLVNRAKKALMEAGADDRTIGDMQERVLNENTKFTLDEARAIVGEYVEFV